MTSAVARVNFFDVTWAGLVIACGIAAVTLFPPATALRGALVFAGGCAVPALAYIAMTRLAWKSEPLPRCRGRRCTAAQYRLERRAEEGDYYRCACGDLYLHTPDDELRIIGRDGSSQPYRQRFYAGGPWRPRES
jgi:hypothetical protein